MRKILLLSLLLLVSACTAPPKADFVLVDKSQNRMYLYQRSEVLRAFNVALGQNPIGHKVQEGDHRTPEGRYMLTFKNEQSKFYRSIRVSYPNAHDVAVAQGRGVSPGGDIVIHGMPNEVGDYRGPISPKNWTQGCIAVRNYEMDEIMRLVDSNTPIEIRP